jgi:hypothetical protein
MITTIHASLSCNASDDLPPNHHITRLVVSVESTRFHHAGPQLRASLHEKMWIPRIRNLMKVIIVSAWPATDSRHKQHNGSGRATTISSPILEAIPHNRRRLNWYHHYNWENRTSNQLHDVSKMLQSSSQMARVQESLAIEGRDWRFIPPRGPHFERGKQQ